MFKIQQYQLLYQCNNFTVRTQIEIHKAKISCEELKEKKHDFTKEEKAKSCVYEKINLSLKKKKDRVMRKGW